MIVDIGEKVKAKSYIWQHDRLSEDVHFTAYAGLAYAMQILTNIDV